MPKFEVFAQRTMIQQASITVEADSKESAKMIAKQIRESIEWNTTDTEYDFSDISEVK